MRLRCGGATAEQCDSVNGAPVSMAPGAPSDRPGRTNARLAPPLVLAPPCGAHHECARHHHECARLHPWRRAHSWGPRRIGGPCMLMIHQGLPGGAPCAMERPDQVTGTASARSHSAREVRGEVTCLKEGWAAGGRMSQVRCATSMVRHRHSPSPCSLMCDTRYVTCVMLGHTHTTGRSGLRAASTV